jgi:hypothetical protein
VDVLDHRQSPLEQGNRLRPDRLIGHDPQRPQGRQGG